MINKRVVAPLLVLAVLTLGACSGGGSSGGAETKQAPYLKSTPQVSFSASAYIPADYDVTVTIQADGPSGIYSASLWIIDVNDSTNNQVLDLVYGGGTTWYATTNYYLPMKSGTYKIDTIVMYDADPFGTSYRMGWYYFLDSLSTTKYVVDQRDVYSAPSFNMLAYGVSSISRKTFTLP
jgi:hypothetical protein